MMSRYIETLVNSICIDNAQAFVRKYDWLPPYSPHNVWPTETAARVALEDLAPIMI